MSKNYCMLFLIIVILVMNNKILKKYCIYEFLFIINYVLVIYFLN